MSEPLDDEDDGCWKHGMEFITLRTDPAAHRVLHCTECKQDVQWDEARADAAAQTAAAVEALRKITTVPVYEQPHTPRSQGGRGFISRAMATALAEATRVLADLSAAAEAHDKAVAERAVQPWREALETATTLPDWTGYRADYEKCLALLTTQEAESAGEPLPEHRAGVCGARPNTKGPYAACCHLLAGHEGMHRSSNGVGATSWPNATPTTQEAESAGEG